MPNDTATPPTQVDPKTTAANLVNNIQKKAAGTPPAKESPKDNAPPADPNAGKEKYVVEGKEIWLTPEQARAYVQKGIAFEPKVSQLAHLQRETSEFLKTLRENPEKILFDQRVGHTPEAVLERILKSNQVNDQTKVAIGQWYYDNVVLPMKMTPEQRELMEVKRQNEEFKSKDATAKDQAIQAENKRRSEEAGRQVLAFVREAMKESGLPDINTPLGVQLARRIIEIQRTAKLQGKTLTPKEAIDFARSDFKTFMSSWLDNLDEENLVKEIGEKNAEKVKKYFLKLVKQNDKQQKADGSTSKGEPRFKNRDDVFDYFAELKKKG